MHERLSYLYISVLNLRYYKQVVEMGNRLLYSKSSGISNNGSCWKAFAMVTKSKLEWRSALRDWHEYFSFLSEKKCRGLLVGIECIPSLLPYILPCLFLSCLFLYQFLRRDVPCSHFYLHVMGIIHPYLTIAIDVEIIIENYHCNLYGLFIPRREEEVLHP
jgi:hypothetical protein